MATTLCDRNQQMSGCLGTGGGMGQVEGLSTATRKLGIWRWWVCYLDYGDDMLLCQIYQIVYIKYV